MNAIVALCLILPTAEASSADRIALLNENYQVIQRTEDDKGACRIALTPPLNNAEPCEFKIDDGQRIVRSGIARWEDRHGLGRTALLEGIPVGGPYTVTVAPRGHNAAAAIAFHNILVGDIWILGGQSNMFGIDVIKENLPALPYLNMLDVQHVQARLRIGRPACLRSTGSRRASLTRICATNIRSGPRRRSNRRSRPRCPSAALIAPISSRGSSMPRRGFQLA